MGDLLLIQVSGGQTAAHPALCGSEPDVANTLTPREGAGLELAEIFFPSAFVSQSTAPYLAYSFNYVYLCVHINADALKSQKRALGLLELEL